MGERRGPGLWEPIGGCDGRGGQVRGGVDGGGALEESEARLVERARNGEVTAYEELVRRYQELAFRVAYVITGSAGDAEDAAQDGFLRAYRALDRFRPGAPFRPWLVRIVANAARTRRGWLWRRRTVPLELAESAAAGVADGATGVPEAEALREESRRELLAAVERLRPQEREVVVCRYFLMLSEEETAAALGCPRGTVKSRSSRALVRLRHDLTLASGAALGAVPEPRTDDAG